MLISPKIFFSFDSYTFLLLPPFIFFYYHVTVFNKLELLLILGPLNLVGFFSEYWAGSSSNNNFAFWAKSLLIDIVDPVFAFINPHEKLPSCYVFFELLFSFFCSNTSSKLHPSFDYSYSSDSLSTYFLFSSHLKGVSLKNSAAFFILLSLIWIGFCLPAWTNPIKPVYS